MEKITITRNKDGNFYVMYHIEVPRGIKRKGQPKANEVLIVGMNKDKFEQFCKDNGFSYESIIKSLNEQEKREND